jgi:hypothetical protein
MLLVRYLYDEKQIHFATPGCCSGMTTSIPHEKTSEYGIAFFREGEYYDK